MRAVPALLIFLAISPPAHAFNALGHKVIAEIAWQEVQPETREEIVATLRRHPRFDEDFAKLMPSDAEEDRWIFQQAAVWPDLARGLQGEDRREYDHPTWYYVNFPFFVDGQAAVESFNLTSQYPTRLDPEKWNVVQAVKHCRSTLAGDGLPSDKALAFCWLSHLVGDLHQPLHSTALVSERFPTGDRGGNSIPTVQGGNLHALWDGLLGRRHRPNDVKREVAELRERPELWKVDTTVDVTACRVQRSDRLASLTIHHARHTFISQALIGSRTLAEVRDAAGRSNVCFELWHRISAGTTVHGAKRRRQNPIGHRNSGCDQTSSAAA